jgi:predicted branched-subunit amino acid permease
MTTLGKVVLILLALGALDRWGNTAAAYLIGLMLSPWERPARSAASAASAVTSALAHDPLLAATVLVLALLAARALRRRLRGSS